MSWDPSIPIFSGELGSCGLHPISVVRRPASSYCPVSVMVKHQVTPAVHALWYTDISKCWFVLRNRRCHIPEALRNSGRAGFSWSKEVTKWFSFDLHSPIHPLHSRTRHQNLDCCWWRSCLSVAYLYTLEHSVRNVTQWAGETAQLVEFALQVQSPEPTLNNTNKGRVWWYALVTPGLERWRQVDQWKQLSLASSKPVSDPASIKMGRILRTVFEVVLWHSDTCTNTKRKEKKHSSKSIFVLTLCKVYILFEFKSAMLPLMTQFSNVYF